MVGDVPLNLQRQHLHMKDLCLRVPRLILLGILVGAALAGCSQLQIAYGTSEFLIKRYADDYLKLDSEQLARWEPSLKAALKTHRAEELPGLAGLFDALHTASVNGFDQANTRCLTAAFRTLYLRHARLATAATAPLLAGLTPAQVQALEQRFAADYADDRIAPGTRDVGRELRKRTKRYVESIEEWTGPLNAAQRTLVADVTGRMPDTTQALLDYRTRKREQLIALLRADANATSIERFLSAWLVDYQDLPPALAAAGDAIGERMGELLIRLGATLDQAQRKRLNSRLESLRDDLMQVQQAPRLVPVGCPAADIEPVV